MYKEKLDCFHLDWLYLGTLEDSGVIRYAKHVFDH